jgi:hypothetical protein
MNNLHTPLFPKEINLRTLQVSKIILLSNVFRRNSSKQFTRHSTIRDDILYSIYKQLKEKHSLDLFSTGSTLFSGGFSFSRHLLQFILLPIFCRGVETFRHIVQTLADLPVSSLESRRKQIISIPQGVLPRQFNCPPSSSIPFSPQFLTVF